MEEAMRLEVTIRERLSELPPEHFEPLLHDVFRDDEWKLIAVGLVPAALIGVAQSYTFGALGMA